MSKTARIVSSFVWTKHWNVIEGQTDGQTDSPCVLERSTLRAMRTHCKDYMILQCTSYDKCSKHSMVILYVSTALITVMIKLMNNLAVVAG